MNGTPIMFLPPPPHTLSHFPPQALLASYTCLYLEIKDLCLKSSCSILIKYQTSVYLILSIAGEVSSCLCKLCNSQSLGLIHLIFIKRSSTNSLTLSFLTCKMRIIRTLHIIELGGFNVRHWIQCLLWNSVHSECLIFKMNFKIYTLACEHIVFSREQTKQWSSLQREKT